MRICDGYTHLRDTDGDVRLKNRAYRYDAVVKRAGENRGYPELAFYDLKTGEMIAPETIAYEQVSAMLQSEGWELIPAVPTVSAQS